MAAPKRASERSAYELSSQEIETLLRTGEKPELLKAYFGDEGYREMRDLARRSARRELRGGPKVRILPGILGSMIGTPCRFFNDVVWFNPVALIAGRATELAVNGNVRHQALDVVPYFYLGLRWRLWRAGFDVAYHYYDWRFGIDTLGEQ